MSGDGKDDAPHIFSEHDSRRPPSQASGLSGQNGIAKCFMKNDEMEND
jgi:hypothetical protein